MTLKIGNSDEFLGNFRFSETPVFFGFETLSDFVDHVEALSIPTDTNARAGWTVPAHFAGTQNMKEALNLARNGWMKGAEKAQFITDQLSATAATKPSRIHSVAGGSVNVGLMLAGNPANMRRRTPQPGKRVITLFVESAASGAIDASIMIKRVAIIAATSDILEKFGYSCEIVAVKTTDQFRVNGERLAYQMTVKIKKAGERLSISDTVFALGHPSFSRRLSFALVGSTKELRNIWDGQGFPNRAFSKTSPPKTNEFYFPMIQTDDLRKVNTENNLEFFKFLLPKGLSVEMN